MYKALGSFHSVHCVGMLDCPQLVCDNEGYRCGESAIDWNAYQ